MKWKDGVRYRKRGKRVLSLLMGLLLLSGLLPMAASGSSGGNEGTTHTLEAEGDLRALMASDAVRDGDTIQLCGAANVNDDESKSAPWVISKAVTIKGGTLNLRAGGILLGADVTFDGVVLSFPNRVRNAIIANGHTLTLKNVLRDGSANAVHLFCGGLTGHEVSAAGGTHGKIIVMGSTSLGNIYAGSMSSNGESNRWEFPSSILIDSSATGNMGVVYACGALEIPIDEKEMINPDYVVQEPAANAAAFTAAAEVSIALRQGVVKTVDGNTGGEQNASVMYDGNDNLCTPTLSNIHSLTVASGNLAPQSSSLCENISVSAGAILDLRGFGDAITVTDFIGGGTLGLGEGQTLTISGRVEGVTAVGIGGIFGNASQGLIDNEHIYIVAGQSAEDSFILLPPQSDPAAAFACDENGNWTVPATEMGSVIVESAAVDPVVAADSDLDAITIPVTVSFVSDINYSYFYEVPVEITIGGENAQMVYGEFGYEYAFSDESIFSSCFFVPDGDVELLCLYGADVIADGRYAITITIPAQYMADDKELTLSTVLLVGEQSGEEQLEISAVRSDDGVIVQLPQNLIGKRIVAAAYNRQNQMTSVSTATASGETVVLPIAGEVIRVFVVGEGYLPILPVLQLA